jgi:hypothetical protein
LTDFEIEDEEEQEIESGDLAQLLASDIVLTEDALRNSTSSRRSSEASFRSMLRMSNRLTGKRGRLSGSDKSLSLSTNSTFSREISWIGDEAALTRGYIPVRPPGIKTKRVKVHKANPQPRFPFGSVDEATGIEYEAGLSTSEDEPLQRIVKFSEDGFL